MDTQTQQVYLNDVQRDLMTVVQARDTVLVAGRAFGKGMVHALWNRRNFERMPGSVTGFVSANIKRALTNTLPSMLVHWERWGLMRNVHWCIGIKPPKAWGWKQPIFPIQNYENVLSFYNGSVGFIISQDRTGTSNSQSYDALDIDEAKFIDFEQYLYTKRNLEEQAREAQIKIYEEWGETDNAKYRDLLKKRAEADLDAIAAQKKQMASLIDSEHRERTDNITMRYYDPTAAEFDNKVALNQALLEEDIRYLRQKQLLYEQNSEEYAAIEKQIQTRVNQDKLDKQKELADAYKQIIGKYLETSAEATKQAELKMLDKLLDAGVITEEQFVKIKKAILQAADAAQTAGQGANNIPSEFGQNLTALYQAIKDIADGAEDLPGKISVAVSSAVAIMSSMMQQVSAYYDAERDLELAKVEKRYDAEIKAAGKNERKKKKLEEQKERETAKIKNKYNKRAQSMELAQAVASTAMAAINAYASASKVNWILGPIAAAMAVAAGAIQIATIQKQHQAQAAGYYSGGYTTRSSDNRREVGIVHANEFVANHQAVANPAIAPVLRLIDQAQKSNTVGSLTAADVSNAIGANRAVNAKGNITSTSTSATINDSAAIIADISARTSKALDRLSDNIEQGILAEVVMDGERGLARKLNHYNKLNQNVLR